MSSPPRRAPALAVLLRAEPSAILRALLWSGARRRRLHVAADGASAAGSRLLRAAARLGLAEPEIVPLALELGVTDSNGIALRCAVETTVARLGQALAPYGEDQPLPARDRPVAAEWARLQRTAVMEGNFAAISRLLMVREALRSGTLAAACAPVRVDVASATRAGAFARLAPALIGVTGWRIHVCRPEQPLRVTLMALLDMLRAALALPRLPPLPAHLPAGAGGSRVLVQFSRLDFDRAPDAGIYCWAFLPGVPRAQIVMVCDRADSPCDARTQADIAAAGFGWIDAGDPRRAIANPRRTVLRLLADLLLALRHCRSRRSLWCWSLVARHALAVEAQRALHRRTGAVAMHQHMDFGLGAMPKLIAARREGVCVLWVFWSMLQFMTARYEAAISDLTFACGAYDREYVPLHDWDAGTVVESGLFAGERLSVDHSAAAAAMRATLAPGVRFVVTLFDTSAGPAVHNRLAHVVNLYRAVLAAVADHPDWAVLLKPKGDSYTGLPPLPGLQDQVAALTAAGRCRLLDGGLPAGLAAAAADLVVCCPINSAGLVAARLGRTTVHLDEAGLAGHPLALWDRRRLEGGRCVVESTEALRRALEAAARGDRMVGDHRPWISYVDAFAEARGAEHMATAVTALIAARDRGAFRDESIAAAAAAVPAPPPRHLPADAHAWDWAAAKAHLHPGWPAPDSPARRYAAASDRRGGETTCAHSA